MSIVKKTIIAVVCMSVALMALIYFVSNTIYLNGIKNIENQAAGNNVNRVREALAAKLEALNTFCYDWAAWDDTYNFAQQYDQTFVDRNFQDETFSSSDLNLIAIFNLSGKMVYAKAYDFLHGREIAVPDDFASVVADEKLLDPADRQNGLTGVVLLTGQPTLVSSRQILTSLAEGPSTGTILMGRFLDAVVINDLAMTTHLTVSMLSMSEAASAPDVTNAMDNIASDTPVYVHAASGSTIMGYAEVNDIKGNPIQVIKVEMPRDVYAQGKKAINVLDSSLAAVLVAFCVLFVFLIRQITLSKLMALNNSVNKIGSSGDLSQRVTVSGKDEVANLSGNINHMLESLQTSEARRRSQKELIGYMVANNPNAVVAINSDAQIALVNNHFLRIFDLKESETTEHRFDEIKPLGDFIPEIRSFLNSDVINRTKEIKFSRDGQNMIYLANFARMTEEKLYFLSLTDVTVEYERQERLSLTNRLASIGEMASGIAHELNNPLTSIIGLSELLAEEEVSTQVKEDLADINNEAKRAAMIVKNMLSFARKRVPQKQLTQINKVVEDVLRLRVHEESLNNITLIKRLNSSLPEIMVDPFQIQQVFINIILNAEQAMIEAHGKGMLIVTSEKTGDNIRVSFTDDGPGISQEQLNRIFDPFFTTKDVGKGTGLGLSISYTIINAHGGLLYARSEPEKGATFIVELPIQTNLEEQP